MVFKQLFNYSGRYLYAVDASNNRLSLFPFSVIKTSQDQMAMYNTRKQFEIIADQMVPEGLGFAASRLQFDSQGRPVVPQDMNQQRPPQSQQPPQQAPKKEYKPNQMKDQASGSGLYDEPEPQPKAETKSAPQSEPRPQPQYQQQTQQQFHHQGPQQPLYGMGPQPQMGPQPFYGHPQHGYATWAGYTPYNPNIGPNMYGTPDLNITPPPFETLTIRSVGSAVGEDFLKNINLPGFNSPTVILDMGLVVFASFEERERAIEMIGSGKEIIAYYLNDSSALFNGAYTGIINLSENDYFLIDNQEVVRIPSMSREQRDVYIRNHGIDIDRLRYNDLLVIVKSTKKEYPTYDGMYNRSRNDTRFINKFVSRDEDAEDSYLTDMDPLIMVNDGFWVFKTESGARKFISNYSSQLDYLIDKARLEVGREHEEEVQMLNEAHKRERNAIVRNAALLAGTTVLGVIVEKVFELFLSNGGTSAASAATAATNATPINTVVSAVSSAA